VIGELKPIEVTRTVCKSLSFFFVFLDTRLPLLALAHPSFPSHVCFYRVVIGELKPIEVTRTV